MGYAIIFNSNYIKINPQIELKFWPKNSKIQRHSFTVIPISIWRPELDFENSDYTIISRWEANFLNSSQFRLEMFNRYTKLYDEFDPTTLM